MFNVNRILKEKEGHMMTAMILIKKIPIKKNYKQKKMHTSNNHVLDKNIIIKKNQQKKKHTSNNHVLDENI